MTKQPENDRQEKRIPAPAAALLRSWFLLTGDERKAVVIVLGLLALGLTVRWVRLHHGG